ncbi:MAG: hypothetical protein KGY76_07580 [Candidatus Thermoplasmatota archaeon]|nr:hypothetical protein [Candidatus Thermoplasmatota archaeon]
MDDPLKGQMELLLNQNFEDEHWNLWYGITERRKRALLKDSPHPDSFFNPNSETALTLFVLGNLDSWSQISSLSERPRRRTKRSSWSKSFFQSLSEKESIEKRENDLWAKPKIRKNLHLKKQQIHKEKKVLLFEFEVACKPVHCGEEKSRRNVSFLDISNKYSKVRYDAVLMIPKKKIFVFFESKLETDTSSEGEGKKRLNQIVKGLEAAFLLTNHEKSIYKDWDFRYVLICPKILDQYGLTSYHRVTDDPGRYLARYNDLLNRKANSSVNNETYPGYFGQFVKKVTKRISKMYWDQTGEVLKSENESFFLNYIGRLKDSDLSDRKVANVRKRLKKGGL